MTELLQLERRLRRTIVRCHPPEQAEVLRILRLPGEDRARAIGELYRWGAVPELVNLLIDVEAEEPAVRTLVTARVIRRFEESLR